MRILFASSEVYPFSKTGGLGDVAGALPAALVALGHEVLVVTPWYATLGGGAAPLWIGDVSAPFAGGFEAVGVGTLERDGVRFAFVGHDDFRRDQPYGFDDDVRRFARFTRAVPQVAERVGFVPDVIHAHDWHTGYLPLIAAHGWHLPDGVPGAPTVFTVHNVQYQGVSDIGATLHWLRLSGDLADSYLNHFGSANAMQAGLGFADRVTTVSPTYAQEIQEPAYGYGLDGTFRHIADKLSGILNGIDVDVWDPATDPTLPATFDRDDLAGKARCKAALCARFGLPTDKPLLGVVSRLADQKGIDLFLDAAPDLLAQGWTVVVLGSGDAGLEARLRSLFATRAGEMAGVVGYDEELAHLIYAGADALAIPSRFEPCGLSQMIAMRYGTLPIARATGGLRDTIAHAQTGFLFEDADPLGVARGASEAIDCFGESAWTAMMRRAMAQDFSWSASARAYAELYGELA